MGALLADRILVSTDQREVTHNNKRPSRKQKSRVVRAHG